MENLTQRIKRHEGLRLFPYQDTLGNWTIGYGRNLTGKGIHPLEAEMFLQRDIDQALTHFDLLPDTIKQNCNPARKNVLVEMMFQLGYAGVKQFKKMLSALEKRDFNQAANEMINSRWYQQTPRRCRELSEAMRHGSA